MKVLKKYDGCRVNGMVLVTVTIRLVNGKFDRRELKPGPSLKLWNHSPNGFEWGYGGSGPAQLALAILLDFTHDGELAVRLHQDFKGDFIARAPHDEWAISGEEIKEWLRQKQLDLIPPDPPITEEAA